MSSDEIAIRVRDVSKHYLLFNQPQDRLKQSIVPRLQRLAGREPKRYYRDFAALSHVSFDVRRGETVGVVGRNGSGKSTLLQVVCGTLRPNSGTVEVNGRIAALLELGAGFNPEFTGRENVYLNAAILGLPRSEIDARFEDIARFADIDDFIEQPVKTYSSGMYVRLAFATAINVDPDILVVDEALAVGDEAFQRKCFARIEQIQERGGTILFVTHAAQTVVQLCTRALLFDRGELLLDGTPKSVTSQYQRLSNAIAKDVPDIRAAITSLRDSSLPVEVAPDTEPADVSLHLTTATDHDVRPDAEALDAKHPSKVLGNSAVADGAGDGGALVTASSKSNTETFDPGLASRSAVSLDHNGARIENCRIATIYGASVNVLCLSKRYIFEYTVTFLADAIDVGFGMTIKTVDGFRLAGVHTILSKKWILREAKMGQSALVRFEFVCRFAPGCYFITPDVMGVIGNQQVILHRIYDAIIFKITSEPDLIMNAWTDADVVPYIEINR